MDVRILVLGLFGIAFNPCLGLPIDGCPIWGCTPSGTFSFTLDVPKTNATIEWVSDFFIGPVPNAGGCVGNSENVVCQSNGPAGDSTGYMSIDASSGKVDWRDPILRFPALPVMDTYGDIWGSDGNQFISYNTIGKPAGPQIDLNPKLRPLFDVQIVGEKILLLVSENGQISMILPDGTPFASTLLRGTVERDNGTFLPTAPPVVNGERFYLLTEFAPDNVDSANLGLQRLYAIDTHQSLSNRVEVVWYANFEREAPKATDTRIYFRPTCYWRMLSRKLRQTQIKPSVLWDNAGQMLFVNLPPPMLSDIRHPNALSRLLGIKDNGNNSAMVFQSDKIVTNMVLFEQNTRTKDVKTGEHPPPSNAGDQFWASLPDGKLLALTKTGSVSKVINLPEMLQVNFTITSKIMTARNRSIDEDFLIFGIHVQAKSDYFLQLASALTGQSVADSDYFLVGYDTPENNRAMPVAWMFPTPDDMPVVGQIVGIPGDGDQSKDRIIAFAETDKAGKLFSVAKK